MHRHLPVMLLPCIVFVASPAPCAQDDAAPATSQPAITYVCSDAEHTETHDAPGVCEVCGEPLKAHVPEDVTVEYFCTEHRDQDPVDAPGKCKVEGCDLYLVARQVQPAVKHKLKYVCVDGTHLKRYDKPGECEKCGKLLKAYNPHNLALEYVCPEHSDKVVAEAPGHCTKENCWLFLEARLEQPTPKEKFVYVCPIAGHDEEFDRPGRCAKCNMFLEGRSSKRLKYVCPHPEHEYFMRRPGKCVAANCTYYLEAETYVEPEPEKKAWYVTFWDWVKGLFGGKQKAANA